MTVSQDDPCSVKARNPRCKRFLVVIGTHISGCSSGRVPRNCGGAIPMMVKAVLYRMNLRPITCGSRLNRLFQNA